jgi:hypothetical protein
MKQIKALKPFFFGDRTLTPADTPVEVDNERAAALVKQGMAEYAGDLPPVDPMLTAHLEPEPDPLPPVLADPSEAERVEQDAARAAAQAERIAARDAKAASAHQKPAADKPEPHKGNDPEPHKRSHHATS